MPTAFELLADNLRLLSDERRVLQVLVRATPIAMRGQPTMAPFPELMAALDVDERSVAGVGAVLRRLATMRAMDGSDWRQSFCLVDSFSWGEEETFVHYKLGSELLGNLHRIAAERGTALY